MGESLLNLTHLEKKIKTRQTVQSTNGQWVFGRGDNFLSLEREQRFEGSTVATDTFGKRWYVGVLSVGGKCDFLIDNKTVRLHGPALVLVPPFSIVQTRFSRGVLSAKGFIFETAFPREFPREATFFPGTTKLPDDLMVLAKQEGIPIERASRWSSLVARSRSFIEESTSKTIAEIAKNLKTTPTYLGRVFKREMGLTMVEYKHLLRALESTFQMLAGASVTESYLQSGFNDVSRYNKAFKKIAKVPPSVFKTPL